MQLDIYAQAFKLTDSLEQHVKQRVNHAIGATSRLIQSVKVRLLDVNGERSETQVTCRVVVRLRGGGCVMIDASDRDLYAAVDAAALKLRMALKRRISRWRTLHRHRTYRRPLVFPPDERAALLPAWSH